MAGRPTRYNKTIAGVICQRLIGGESLRSICKDDALPGLSTVTGWLANPEHAFSEQYAHAREIQAELLADEMAEIADDGTNDWMERQNKDGENVGWQVNGEAVSRSKLRVDTRKWIASKLLPKRYGDRSQMELTGKDGKDLVPNAGVLLVPAGVAPADWAEVAKQQQEALSQKPEAD